MPAVSARPRVVITRSLVGDAAARLRDRAEVWSNPDDAPLEAARLAEAAAGATAILAMPGDRIDGPLLDAAGAGLRIVANHAVGYDNIDLGACAARGVIATNTPGVLVDATADLAMALILSSLRRLSEGERLLRAGAPWAWSPSFLLGSDLQGAALGIVGLGAIGAATARRARAFGMTILYAGRSRADPALEAELGATRLDLDGLLEAADVVSLHCPLTAETRRLIDRAALRRMRPTAHLINTSRGPVVDEAALAEALTAGEIAGAALDVYEDEPRVHPGLLELENVVLIPHLGSATIATRRAMADLAAANILAVLDGAAPLTPIRA